MKAKAFCEFTVTWLGQGSIVRAVYGIARNAFTMLLFLGGHNQSMNCIQFAEYYHHKNHLKRILSIRVIMMILMMMMMVYIL